MQCLFEDGINTRAAFISLTHLQRTAGKVIPSLTWKKMRTRRERDCNP